MRGAYWAGLACLLAAGCGAGEADDGDGGAGGAGATGVGGSGAVGAGATGGQGGGGGSPLPPWAEVDSSTEENLRGVWVHELGYHALAVGDGGIIVRTADGGDAWSDVASGTSEVLRGVFGVDDDVYVVGDQGTILHSSDRGESFAAEASGTTSDLHSVSASGPTHVWIGGSAGTLIESVDDGASWQPIGNPAITPIRGLWGLDASHLYAVAEVSLLTSTDGGDGWFVEALSLTVQNDVWAASTDDVFIVNNGGVIITKVGGEPWVKRIILPAVELKGIWGSDVTEMFVVGALGRVLRSQDGVSWAEENSGTNEALQDVFGAGGRVFAVGNAGTITRRGE